MWSLNTYQSNVKVHKATIRPVIFYSFQNWTMEKQEIDRMGVDDMKMFRWINEKQEKMG